MGAAVVLVVVVELELVVAASVPARGVEAVVVAVGTAGEVVRA